MSDPDFFVLLRGRCWSNSARLGVVLGADDDDAGIETSCDSKYAPVISLTG